MLSIVETVKSRFVVFGGGAIRRGTVISAGHLGVVILQVANAVIIVRSLSRDSYGGYSLVNALSQTVGKIGLRGCDGAVIALAGECDAKGRRLESIRRAGCSVAGRTSVLFVLPTVLISIYALAPHYDSLWSVALGVSVVIALGAVFAQRMVNQSALVSVGRVGAVYSAIVASELFRSVAMVAMWIMSSATGESYLVVVLASGVLLWRLLRKVDSGSVGTDVVDGDVGVIARRTRPLIPGIIFGSVYANMTVILAGMLSDTVVLGEFSAGARLYLVFSLFSAFSEKLWLPMIAKAENEDALVAFLGAVVATVGGASVVAGALWLGFDIVLSVIGEQYAQLTGVLEIILLTHVLNCVNNLFWCVQIARGWIWPWMPVVSIPFSLAVQVVCLLVFGAETLDDVSKLALGAAIGTLMLRMAMLCVGWRKYRWSRNLSE